MSIRPVVVSFQAEGVREIQRAFKNVQQAMLDADRAGTRSAQAGAKERERAQVATAKSGERLAKQAAKETERAEREKTRAVLQGNKERERAFAKLVKESERWARDDVRAFERAEREKTKIAERESRARGSIAQKFGRATGRAASNAIGTASRIGATVAAVGGGIGVTDILQSTIKNKGKAADIALQSNNTITRDQILKQAQGLSKTTGFETAQILEAADAFGAKSGDYKNIGSTLEGILKMSNATGADPKEMADMVGIFQANGGDAKRSMQFAQVAAGMGREGSVDPRDFAQYGGRVSSAANKFANTDTAFTQLSAMTQQAVKAGGASNAAEATTGIQRFVEDIYKHEGDLDQMLGAAPGKHAARDKTGQFLADPRTIIAKAVHATKGDEGKLQRVFKGESIKTVAGYADAYKRASAETVAKGGSAADGDKAGMKALEAAFDQMENAVMTAEQVERESAKRMEEADKQLVAVFEQLKSEAGEKLLPELVKLIPVLQELIPSFTKMLAFAAENPFSTLGIMLAASITKEIAAAKVAQIFDAAATKAASGVSAAGNTLAGRLGAIAVILYVAEKAFEKGVASIDAMFAKKTGVQNEGATGGGVDRGKEAHLLRKLKDGTATPEEKAEAQKMILEKGKSLKRQGDAMDPENKSLTEKLVGAAGSGAIGKAMGMQEAQEIEYRNQVAGYTETKNSMEALAAALKENTEATKNNTRTPPNNGPSPPPPGPSRGERTFSHAEREEPGLHR